MGTLLRYLFVGAIGAVIGGAAVARATGALPKIMAEAMARGMKRMEASGMPERCRAMMRRFAADGAIGATASDEVSEAGQVAYASGTDGPHPGQEGGQHSPA